MVAHPNSKQDDTHHAFDFDCLDWEFFSRSVM